MYWKKSITPEECLVLSILLRAVVAKNRAGQKVTFSDHQVS